MAFSAKKYNKGSVFTFKAPDSFEYTSLDELYHNNEHDWVYPVKALFINKKSKYGDHPVIVTDNEYVSVPKHLTDTVKAMIADDEAVDAINSGKLGFTIYEYVDSKYKRTCYSVTWIDM